MRFSFHEEPNSNSSQEPAKFLFCETGISNNTAHRDGIDWIASRNGENATSIRHDDVLSLPHNPKARLLQSPYSPEMWHSRDLAHA